MPATPPAGFCDDNILNGGVYNSGISCATCMADIATCITQYDDAVYADCLAFCDCARTIDGNGSTTTIVCTAKISGGGSPGPTGGTGSKGATGPAGATGSAGPTGATGVQGPAGATGPTGPCCAGPTGATGVQGPAGPTGATGPQGIPGAAALKGATGATGTTGPTGPQGATGAQGSTGSTGAQGPTGATGSTGVQGATGSTGAQGPTGATGAQGLKGSTGSVGVTGSQGTTGTSIYSAIVTGNKLILTIIDYSTGLTSNIEAGTVVGATGVAGATGTTGVRGATGATGATGVGVNVVNAYVSIPDGNLILVLSDSTTINAGTVVGPAGADGATGIGGGGGGTACGCVSCCDPLQGKGGTAVGCQDLVNIDRLVLSDTFHTWYDRTNQIIDAVNPLNLYEIAGLTGIELVSGKDNCNYNGVVGIGFKNGPGITWGHPSNTTTSNNFRGKMFVDPGTLPINSGMNGVTGNDLFIFKDMSDVSTVKDGTPKSVQARFMLPPKLEFTALEMDGNVTINGNLLVGGNNSFIASNDLRIEDKNIELAYQTSGLITITGPSAAIRQLYALNIVGASAFYDDYAANPGSTAEVIGVVKSITGPVSGMTAQVRIGSMFSAGGAEDFQTGGKVKFKSPTGPTSFTLLSFDGATTDFFTDAQLDGAGLTVKGLSGDKTFVWESSSEAWISYKNLGVDTETGFITARNYRNKSLTAGDAKNDFTFIGTSGQAGNPTIRLTYDNKSVWGVSHNYGATGSPLVLSYGTGQSSTEFTLSTIYGLTTGPYSFSTTSGGTSNMWAKGFNADYLDGAGATTGSPYGGAAEPNEGFAGSTAYSIPISDSRGRINSNWLESDSNRIRVKQTTHGLTAGNCIVREVSYAVGATATKYIKASPLSVDLADTVGIVVEVLNANEFVYVNTGLATIPVPGDVTPGVALMMNLNGGLTSDFGATFGDPYYIAKNMFIPVSITGSPSNRKATGVVLSQPGFMMGGSATDEIYAQGLVPVGSIMPYSGTLNELSDEWILCDGRKLRPGVYQELYKVIGTANGRFDDQKYYADASVSSFKTLNFADEEGTPSGAGNNAVELYIKGGNRNFQSSPSPSTSQGDLIRIEIYSKVTNATIAYRDARVYSVDGTYQITAALRKFIDGTDTQSGYTRNQFSLLLSQAQNAPRDYSVRVYGRHRTDVLSTWGTVLVPDLRNRTVFGAGAGADFRDNGSMMMVGDVLHTLAYNVLDGLVQPVLNSPSAGLVASNFVPGGGLGGGNRGNGGVVIGGGNGGNGTGTTTTTTSTGDEGTTPDVCIGCNSTKCNDATDQCFIQSCPVCDCYRCENQGCSGSVNGQQCKDCSTCKQGGQWCQACAAQGYSGSVNNGHISCVWLKQNICDPTTPPGGCTACACCDPITPCYRIDGIADCIGCSGCHGCTGCGSTADIPRGGISGDYHYPPAVVTYWIIRARPEVNALILTGHNHDDRYVRHDMQPQKELHTDSGMTASRRANARYNAQSLSRETGDTHYSPVVGGGLTFAGMGKYKFFAGSLTSQGAEVEVENPYGWGKVKIGGAQGGIIDLTTPFDQGGPGLTTENYDLRLMSGVNSGEALIVAGPDRDIRITVEGVTGINRNWGVTVVGGSGNDAGMVGIRTDTPTMSLEVRGSGVKIGPHIFDGNTTGNAPPWNTVPVQGMFYGGMFNSTGLTTINTGLTMNSALFPQNPQGVYTVDPGSGIMIVSGKTVVIQSGFKWKIL